jgi:Domain of unknown function (DUF4386)
MPIYTSLSKEEVRMETTSVSRTSREAGASPDPSWRDLYRAGGVSAFLYIALLIVPIVLIFTTPQPPISGGAATLEYIASNKLVYITELVLFLAPSVVAMIVFLALYMALKHVNKSLAAIGALIAIASQIIGLAYNSSPQSLNSALVLLSDQYMAAISAAQRAAYATAAESLIAMANAVSASGIMFSIGILLISMVMLKGVFNKGIAYLGIVTGAIAILSEAFRPFISFGYIVFFILEVIWFIAVGWKLFRLGGKVEV